LLNASQEKLDKLKVWRDDIRQDVAAWNSHIKIVSDVGAKLAAGIFNKETETIHQLMAKSFKLSPINNILLNSSRSETLLFSDNKKIAKAMEAAERHRPYPPKSTFPRSSGSKSRGGIRGRQHPRKPTPYQKPKSIQSSEAKKSGKRERLPFSLEERGGRPGRK
jgi:hypothetical protein